MPSVFVSYSSADRVFARRVATDLTLAGAAVWFDEVELRVGDAILSAIASAVERIDYFIVVLSPAAIASRWVMKELEVASAKELTTGRVVVLPLLLHDCPMPPQLVGKRYVDCRTEGAYTSSLAELKSRIGLRASGEPLGDTRFEVSMVHRIHEDMTIIAGYVDLFIAMNVQIDLDDPLRVLQVMRASAWEATFLVTEMVVVRQFATGRYDLRLYRQNIQAAVAVARALGPIVQKDGGSLTVNVPSEEVLITCDMKLVRIACYALIMNAVRLAPKGAAVEFAVSSNRSNLYIACITRGPALAAVDEYEIFNPATTPSAEDARRHVDHGLYLCNVIASAHGGRLTYAHVAGDMNVFQIELPIDPMISA
jgi:signal transduction histidine kinase